MAGAAQATVTLQMSSATNYATNFLSGTGTQALMAWGIVVDTAGTGFAGATAANPYSSFGNITGGANGITLSTVTGGLSTNVLYLSTNLMNATTNTTDGGSVGLNRITNLSSIIFANGVAAGKKYEVIWFDTTSFGGASQGVKYGLYDMGTTVVPSTGVAADLLPNDPGTYSLAPAWAGADSAKSMVATVGVAVPEPTAALLGAFGVLGLLRRRRN